MPRTFWLADDDARSLAPAVRQRLPSGVEIGLSAERKMAVPHAGVIARRVPLSAEEMRELPSVVLLDPDLDERDRVQSALAGWEPTALTIIEDPGPAIHAERTLALILALANRIPDAVAALRASDPNQSALVTGEMDSANWLRLSQPSPLLGQRLGLIGFRQMGRELAARAAALGMEIAYWPVQGSARERQEIEAAAMRSAAAGLPFDRLLQTSDIIVIDVDFAEATQRLIDAPELALMRPDALLVNTTSGRAIDEGALIQALRGGYLGGVALDVFNYAPLPADSPLRTFDRALLTPHIARPPAALVRHQLAGRIAAALLTLSGSEERPRRVRHVERKRG